MRTGAILSQAWRLLMERPGLILTFFIAFLPLTVLQGFVNYLEVRLSATGYITDLQLQVPPSASVAASFWSQATPLLVLVPLLAVLMILVLSGLWGLVGEASDGTGTFNARRFPILAGRNFWKAIGLVIIQVLVAVVFLGVPVALLMFLGGLGAAAGQALAIAVIGLGFLIFIPYAAAFLILLVPFVVYWIPATFIGPGVLAGMRQAWRLAFSRSERGFGGAWVVELVALGMGLLAWLVSMLLGLLSVVVVGNFSGVVPVAGVLQMLIQAPLLAFPFLAQFLLYREKAAALPDLAR